MILESARLFIRPGQRNAFEAAMNQAKALIGQSGGFLGMEVRPCLENPDLYLLLVKWNTLEDHTVGFRGSAPYQEWRRLLHHFYDPFPEVEHWGDPVAALPGPAAS